MNQTIKELQERLRLTHEILPSVKKHGFYDTDNFIDNIIANPDGIVIFVEKYIEYQLRQQLAEQQRDEAIEAINSKNRKIIDLEIKLLFDLYLKNRKIKYLEWQLYDLNTWAPVRDISWLKDFFNIDQVACTNVIGRKLSYESRRLKLYPRQIAYPKCGIINIYHKNVIQSFHRFLIKNPNYMKRFRR
jgi:hypothetical protein